MVFDPGASLGFTNSPQGEYFKQMLATLFQNPLAGTSVEHYQAQLVDESNFDRYGIPDYLAPDAGQHGAGIKFTPNPDNPLRGIFCRAKINPFQDKGGIYYQAQMSLYLAEDPGDIFLLDGKYPKRQDKFVIQGGVYYATAPAMPCQIGETVAAWQVDLSRERYPVRNDSGLPSN